MTVDRIVSFVDMPKTWLSLAGAEIPVAQSSAAGAAGHVMPSAERALFERGLSADQVQASGKKA